MLYHQVLSFSAGSGALAAARLAARYRFQTAGIPLRNFVLTHQLSRLFLIDYCPGRDPYGPRRLSAVAVSRLCAINCQSNSKRGATWPRVALSYGLAGGNPDGSANLALQFAQYGRILG